jgi:hypothetical protein
MRFHRLAVAFTGILTLGVASQSASAQIATQTVTFSVVSMSRAAVSGTVSPIMVRSVRADRAPTSASVGGTTYAITTNEANQKIAASLDQPMPTGVSLAVALAAPAGAASRGTTNLGTASADVVTGITGVNATALPIVYTLSASSAPAAPSTRVVTFTITAGL